MNPQRNQQIARPEYLQRLLDHKDVDLVKIITGIRRCGKSTLLDLFHDYLTAQQVPEERIIHMNMESLQYHHLKDYLTFYDYIRSRITGGGGQKVPRADQKGGGAGQGAGKKLHQKSFEESDQTIYLLFDELQEVAGWEKAIESFRIDFHVDIYITGSNAYIFSSEFSTLLSGRYVEIPMLPLSFKEFLQFYDFGAEEARGATIGSATGTEIQPVSNVESQPAGNIAAQPTQGTLQNLSKAAQFQQYLKIGGMPVLRQYELDAIRSNQALEGIYSTIVLKDVLQRNNISNQNTLEKIMRFLCANIGNRTSPNRIGNVLSSEGDIDQGKKRRAEIAGKTVDTYISMLAKAFIVYPVNRYDIKGKEHLKTLGKYYLADLGFRNMLLGYRDADRGHILENIVYLELIRRGYRVSIGKVGDKEIDFVAEKPTEKIYMQVTESMATEEVRKRELSPLQAIRDNYEKIVLSLDVNYITSTDGIQLCNLVDWLLER